VARRVRSSSFLRRMSTSKTSRSSQIWPRNSKLTSIVTLRASWFTRMRSMTTTKSSKSHRATCMGRQLADGPAGMPGGIIS